MDSYDWVIQITRDALWATLQLYFKAQALIGDIQNSGSTQVTIEHSNLDAVANHGLIYPKQVLGTMVVDTRMVIIDHVTGVE